MKPNVIFYSISKQKIEASRKFIFHFFSRTFPLCLVLVLAVGNVWGQTAYLMSSGNYSEQFTNISNSTNWPNGFNGTDCTEWGAVAVNTSGTVGDGVRITVSTADFKTGTAGGVQRGSANIQLLSTSTANSCAIDLFLDFTGRTAGTISFDVATVFNSTGDRDSRLKLFYSTDGTTFTEITGTNLPYTARNNVAGSPSISVSLPSALNNTSTVRLRFYQHSTTAGATPTGSQPKISIDNISVTSTAASTAPTLTTPTVSSITTSSAVLGATVSSNGGAALTERGTVWGTTASPTGNSIAEGGTTVAAFTHSRTGLTANTAYTYRGYATNAAGTGYSADGTFTTLPLAPTVGTGSSVTSSDFTANWSHPTMGSASYTYTVEVDNDNDFSSITTTVNSISSSNTSEAITGLASGTTYYYRVKAVNAQGSSAWSSTSAGVTTSSASSNNCPNGATVTPNMDQEVCENEVLNTDTVTPSYSGGTGTPTVQYQWYYNTTNSNTITGATAVSGATSATFTPLSSSSEVGTRYYFCVAYATDNSCAQTSTTQSLASNTVKVVVNGIPTAPTGTASQSYCAGQTVSNLSATGSSIRWYNASSAGTAWSSSSALSSTNYYASQTVNGCESSNRLAVAVTVNSIPSAPTGNAAQAFCSGQTVSYLSATGTGIQWYSGSSGGTPLITSSALSSTNYYASQTVNGCESSNRFQVAATVNSISTPINIVASNANCSSFDLTWDAVNCASGYKLDVFNYTTSNQILINNSGTTGSSGWIETSIAAQASGYISMLSSSSTLTTPSIDLSNATNSNLNFKIRTYGGISGSSNVITVSISTDNGSTWTSLGTKTAANNTLTSVTPISLSSYNNSSQVKVRFQTLSATGTIGIGIDDIIIDKDYLTPLYISGFQDLNVSSTSKSVTGLSPNTKYYYRVRSNDGTNTSASSNIDSFTTPALGLTTNGTLSPICYNASNTTSLTYSASADNPNSYTIDWNAAANTAGLSDQTATAMTPNAGGGSISTISIPSNAASGTYLGIMTLTNAAGCSITKNLSLTINPLPTISISASPANAITCQGSSVTLTATAGLSSYAWSSGASTTNTAAFSPTATNTYSVTGTDGNGCINSATQTVNYYPASSYVGLPTSNVSGAVEQCTESNGWTYYALPSNPSQYLFGIYKNGNTFTATVDITLDNINKFRKSASSNGANQEHASYIMSRYWNVNATGTVGSGVKVRFFIDSSDITALLNARDNDYDTLKNTTNPSTFAVKSGFEWFKTVGTVYAPTNWLGNTHNGTIVKLIEDTVGTLNGQTYVELSGITSFSGGSGGAAFGPTSNGLFNNGGVVGLPVTWNQVDVNTLENGNEVVWSTSSEQNTSHFEVEYSEDAVQFYKVSENIPAAGNSSTTQYYKFLHESEMKPWLYYRVKQVDLYGKVDYSKIIIAKRATKLPDFKVLIYPIPLIEGDLNLDIHSIAQTELQIRIIDLLGKEVHREKVPSKGYRTQHQLQLNHLPKGQYHIQIDNSIFNHQQRLVLMK